MHFGENTLENKTTGLILRVPIGVISSNFISLVPKNLHMPLNS